MVDNSMALRLVIRQDILKISMVDERNLSQDYQDITGKKDKGALGAIHHSQSHYTV